MSCQDTTGYESSEVKLEKLSEKVRLLEQLAIETNKILMTVSTEVRRLIADTEIIRREQK